MNENELFQAALGLLFYFSFKMRLIEVDKPLATTSRLPAIRAKTLAILQG